MDLIFPEAVADATDAQLLDWYRFTDDARPRLRFNFVASLDGAAIVDGKAAPLSEPEDQRLLHLLRRPADVLLIGAGTVRAEGYGGDLLGDEGRGWRRRAGMDPHPRVAVVSRRLDLDPATEVFTTAPARPLVITCEAADRGRRREIEQVADVLLAGTDTVDPRAAVRELAALGLRRIHSEGGPALFGSFQDADLVDELCLSLSPVLASGNGRRIADGRGAALRRLRLVHVLRAADLLLLLYRREVP